MSGTLKSATYSADSGANEAPAGVVLTLARSDRPRATPRITAFIWGGKVRPRPELPFGSAR